MSTDQVSRVEGPALRAARAEPSVTNTWDPLEPPPIDGVDISEVKNVVYGGGVLTELYRAEWFDDSFPVGHVVHVSLMPGQVTKWHCHKLQRDIVFPVCGTLRMGFHDGREASPTFGRSFAMNFDPRRPRYVHIPTGVWHCLKNVGAADAVYVVLNDLPYEYEAPDDWVLAADSPDIPFSIA